MIATARHMQTPAMESAEYSMKGPFTVSLLFHVGFFLFTLVSLPFVVKDPIIITPISVELISPEDLKKAPPKIEDKPKPIEKPKEPEPPKPPPEPEPEPEQVKEPDPVPPPPKPEAEKPVEKPKPPKPKPKDKPKPKEKPKDTSMDSLLKDILERDEPKPNEQVEEQVREIPDFNAQLSDIEQLNLEEGISPCWRIDGGGRYAENLTVKVRVTLYNDMRVKDVQVMDQIRYATDSAFRAAADSARRALLNPSCSQLNLPAQKYRNKYIDITFDPSKMLGY